MLKVLQFWIPFQNLLLLFGRQFRERLGLVLRAGLLLVDHVEDVPVPFDDVAARLFVGLVVAGVIHHQLGAVLFPILDRRKAEVLVEIPADLHSRAEDRSGKTVPGRDYSPLLVRGHIVAALHEFQVDTAVVRIVHSPFLAELAQVEHLRVGVLRLDRLEPIGKVVRIHPRKERHFIDRRQESVPVMIHGGRIEVHVGHVHLFLQSKLGSVKE